MRRQVFVSFMLLIGTAVAAQRPTLRERVAQERADVAITINVDGPLMVFERVIEATDHVVRATIGQAMGHLSEDGRDVYTTYELANPRVFFSAKAGQSPRPGVAPAPLILAQPGGTVAIDGFTATVVYDDVTKLSSGMDVVLLLHEDKGKSWPAGPDGVFEVRDSRIVPIDRRAGEHRRFAGMSADAFLAEIVARRRGLQTK